MRFTKDHIWVKYNLETKIAECGISFYAQKDIGKVTTITLPEIGKFVHKNDLFGKIESVSSILNLYSPVEFEVTQVD